MPNPPEPLANLAQYLKVQRATDRQLAALYRQAARDATRQLEQILGAGAGATVRRAQVLAARAEIQTRAAALLRKVGAIVAAGKLEAAAAADRNAQKYDEFLMRTVKDDPAVKAYLAGHEQASRTAVDLAERRILGRSYIPFSEQVYRTGAVTSGIVDSAVNSAVARGLSAREFAAELAGLIDPSTPGGVSYAAMRLARTELNNAHHARSVDNARDRPWVSGMKWSLSSSHPKADECDDYAAHDDGHGIGVYRVEDVPAKPHPHDLCIITEVETGEYDAPSTGKGASSTSADPEGDWLDHFFAGDYDDYIDKHRGAVGAESTPALLNRARTGG